MLNLDAMLPLTLSDVVLLVDFVLAAVVAAYFTFGGPLFAWTRDPLGWVIFSYSVVTVGLLFLIVWGIVFGQKIDEWVRFLFAGMFGGGLVGKGIAMYGERRKGRLARAQFSTPEGRLIMSSLTPTTEEIKDVTTIWYKGKRVLRTAFSTLITLLPIAPQVIAIVNEQWSSEFLLAVGVQAVLINSAVTRIMAIPAVNAWLTKVGLGSVPASAIYKSPATGRVAVKVDPQATR